MSKIVRIAESFGLWKIVAKLSLNSTQLQLKLRLRLALFPTFPATQPPMTVVSMEGKLKITSGLHQDYFAD